MASCIIFGGAGYIGSFLTTYFLDHKIFDKVHIADITNVNLPSHDGITTSITDVRQPISLNVALNPEWIFNLAAIHREPGHTADEYFETNIKCAEHVTDYASKVDCKNIFFFSSIAVYGPTTKPLDEYFLTKPTTPYGISKLTAEYIHKAWKEKDKENTLIICRPGVIYGPKDPGNILRMIKAIQKGYFLLPASPHIYKSYGYIFGLLESVTFAMNLKEKYFCYNYVEHPTVPLGEMINIIKEELNVKSPVIRIPFILVYSAAFILSLVKGSKSGIHPRRVKKIATSTHIIPRILTERGFVFNFSFKESLKHWRKISKEDFV